MSIAKKITEAAEKYITEVWTTTALAALAGAIALIDRYIPVQAMQSLGLPALWRIVIAQLAISMLLIAWVVYIRRAS
jgi:hypothetical protein